MNEHKKHMQSQRLIGSHTEIMKILETITYMQKLYKEKIKWK